MSDNVDSWRLYRGTSEVSQEPPRLPAAPPWRTFTTRRKSAPLRYRIGTREADVVNAALHLRRPLLVTGRPGAGKSSLAASIALELGLGDLLRWPVNSKTSLADGLYKYDAVGRLRDTGRARELGTIAPEVGSYIRLGPLGTALATSRPGRPRVLLIDEIDKGDIDLPNDLLVVFEEGSFEIPELVRLPDDSPDVQVMLAGSRQRYTVQQGIVSCTEFPVVVMTSNGERDFPAPFLRRCVRLDLQEPTGDQLREIVRAHLGEEGLSAAEDLIGTFLERRDQGQMALATDQLLNAVHLRVTGVDLGREGLLAAVLRPLEEAGPTLE
ncbi:AAA family ATPase [Streptomyces sp. NPDC004082]|jgi:MoxR-like ATPase|uniref:AAA family ATPase n=1 Tax=unclassified Streptomyces TaxID=2593676 RepID=UPI0033A95CE3